MKENNNLTVKISKEYGFFKRLLAFIGPAYLVSVGYMDPGNWATDIAGGSKFGYRLIWVILLSNIMAIIFQSLSAKLGIVTGKDLAQACRSHYNKGTNIVLWILCEIAIIATDIAEVLGSAIGLYLVFGIPLIYGVIITGFDTLLLLLINNLGIRKMEAFIVMLIFIIGVSFLVEVLISKPDFHEISLGFIPSIPSKDALFIGIGIIGATIMPHNLYLHSSLVQTRNIERTYAGVKQAVKFNFIDSIVALNLAFFVNAGILILSAAVFYRSGNYDVENILQAHKLLQPILGNRLAPILFGIALLASGQSSTITGTYAGQIVMEGFINLRLQPWVRRIITRILAIIPAIFTILYYGENATSSLLVLSQVILSLQLAFAIIPLIHFVSNRFLMKNFAVTIKTKILCWILAIIIIVLNVKLVIDSLTEWINSGTSVVLYVPILGLCILLASLLLYIIVEPFIKKAYYIENKSIHENLSIPDIDEVKKYKKIALALDFSINDRDILSHAVNMASNDCTLVLIHVVESVGANIYGEDIKDSETMNDIKMLENYASSLKSIGINNVVTKIGYGKPAVIISQFIDKNNVDIIIFGTHGHRGIYDVIFGTTIDKVRHKIQIPMLIAK
ncbi:Nramp family divalent metal transporter [Clostridium felsineum]|uniref:Divalent metal cation transporter MntH n=1 Tax=Clostridium felsineum TaxID=36839 RepID=A0A1S8MHP5_9CLOT|nr:Nramp family divalent metal transporter [Clostridium felsineum]URZ00301.1 Divalent metal cation transporter MntH [Clostridium felsineum]URZ07061.1 Divalent metal cation transporter MntH [Clostridium felsineum]URZ12091.1 Divalent metal cation transporter MntH [Clostridium felsineum]